MFSAFSLSEQQWWITDTTNLNSQILYVNAYQDSPLGIPLCAAGDVALDLRLVYPVHGQPNQWPTNREAPKSVSLPWVNVKTVQENRNTKVKKSFYVTTTKQQHLNVVNRCPGRLIANCTTLFLFWTLWEIKTNLNVSNSRKNVQFEYYFYNSILIV